MDQARSKTSSLLRRAHQHILQEWEKAIAPFGVTAQQFLILELVSEGQCNSPAKMAIELGLDAGGVTRLCERLVRKELLQRKPCSEDRRVCYLELTPRAKKCVPEIKNECNKFNEKFLNQFSQTDLHSFHGFLEKISNI